MSFPFIEHVAWLHSAGAEWAARARWRGAPVWRARSAGDPLTACAELLEQVPRGPVRFLDRATLLLGFPYVHYLMLPWQTGLYSSDDWQGFAEATFSQQAGLDLPAWQVQLADGAFGQQRLAVATPRDLLHDLRDLFKLHHLPLGHLRAAADGRRPPVLAALARRLRAGGPRSRRPQLPISTARRA